MAGKIKIAIQDILVLFLAMLLLGRAVCNTSSCNNILTDRIRAMLTGDMKSALLRTPVVQENEYCSFHWGVSGTCCDQSKLSKSLPEYLDKWVEKLQSFTNSLNGFSRLIKENNWKIINRMTRLYSWADETIKKGNHKFSASTVKILKK